MTENNVTEALFAMGSSSEDWRHAIKCHFAVLQSETPPPSPLLAIQARLQAARLLIAHTHNLSEAKALLDRATLDMEKKRSIPPTLKLAVHRLHGHCLHLLGSTIAERHAYEAAIEILNHECRDLSPPLLAHHRAELLVKMAATFEQDATRCNTLLEQAREAARMAQDDALELTLLVSHFHLHFKLDRYKDSMALLSDMKRMTTKLLTTTAARGVDPAGVPPSAPHHVSTPLPSFACLLGWTASSPTQLQTTLHSMPLSQLRLLLLVSLMGASQFLHHGRLDALSSSSSSLQSKDYRAINEIVLQCSEEIKLLHDTINRVHNHTEDEVGIRGVNARTLAAWSHVTRSSLLRHASCFEQALESANEALALLQDELNLHSIDIDAEATGSVEASLPPHSLHHVSASLPFVHLAHESILLISLTSCRWEKAASTLSRIHALLARFPLLLAALRAPTHALTALLFACLGQHAVALRHYDKATSLLHASRPGSTLSATVHVLAALTRLSASSSVGPAVDQLGSLHQAISALLSGNAVEFQSIGSYHVRSLALFVSGCIHRRLDAHDAANICFQKAIALHQQHLGNTQLLSHLSMHLADVHVEGSSVDRSKALCTEAFGLARMNHDRASEVAVAASMAPYLEGDMLTKNRAYVDEGIKEVKALVDKVMQMPVVHAQLVAWDL